jgi:hypothetical protein
MAICPVFKTSHLMSEKEVQRSDTNVSEACVQGLGQAAMPN